MHMRQPRYSKEEQARRGDDLYERLVRSHVEAGNLGKIVAIDVEPRDNALWPRDLARASCLQAQC